MDCSRPSKNGTFTPVPSCDGEKTAITGMNPASCSSIILRAPTARRLSISLRLALSMALIPTRKAIKMPTLSRLTSETAISTSINVTPVRERFICGCFPMVIAAASPWRRDRSRATAFAGKRRG